MVFFGWSEVSVGNSNAVDGRVVGAGIVVVGVV